MACQGGMSQQKVTVAFVSSAVCVVAECHLWAGESFTEGELKGNGPPVDFDFQIKRVTLGLTSF